MQCFHKIHIHTHTEIGAQLNVHRASTHTCVSSCAHVYCVHIHTCMCTMNAHFPYYQQYINAVIDFAPIGKRRIVKTSGTEEEVDEASTVDLLQNVPQQSAEPDPCILNELSSERYPADVFWMSDIPAGDRPQIHVDPQFKVAYCGECQLYNTPPSQDDPEDEFPPVHYRPSPQGCPSENISQCDTEILSPGILKPPIVSSEPL